MLFGTILYSSPRKCEIMLGVEVGYKLTYYPCHFNSEATDLSEGMQVVFTGEWRGDKFRLQWIIQQKFYECNKCLKPFARKRCEPKNTAEPKRIVGVWKVVFKRRDKIHCRLFLSQKNFVFAVTAYPGMWHYTRFRKLQISDHVRISGWLKEKFSLKSIRRCTWVSKNPNQLSEDNLQNNCSARYSTDNSSSDVTYMYKRT